MHDVNDVREYLLHWKSKDKNWKFQKAKQNWIVRNLYSMEKDLFKISIKYLKAGSVKPFIIDNAKAILEKAELPQESEDTLNQKKHKKECKRARKVLKLNNK
jgi:hypothetical protein